MGQIKDLMVAAYNIAKEKGFHDKPGNVGERLMLIVSELGEAMEAHRDNKVMDLYFVEEAGKEDNWSEENGGIESFKEFFEENVKNSLQDEIADVAIRLFDFAEEFQIDLEKHIELKMKYNKTRKRLHGKSY